jgi:hypothetical protein
LVLSLQFLLLYLSMRKKRATKVTRVIMVAFLIVAIAIPGTFVVALRVLSRKRSISRLSASRRSLTEQMLTLLINAILTTGGLLGVPDGQGDILCSVGDSSSRELVNESKLSDCALEGKGPDHTVSTASILAMSPR